jgi:hypothetical protein
VLGYRVTKGAIHIWQKEVVPELKWPEEVPADTHSKG